FDFVVLDPPWPNASVKRSKIYKEMDVFDLYQLPLPSILAQDAIVCLWVTNKLKYHELAKKLFKKWRLHLYKQIIWIKMKDGQLIFDIRSKHRKPFEICLVARTGPPATSVESVFLGASQTFHSQKPSLEYLFDLKDKKKLELFARRVVEDWTCWGNETLLFNAI
ncbi:MT-A70-like protein, partial [Gorgonomyces haynaldii]